MTKNQLMLAIFTTLMSGLLFYFSTDFHQLWPLLWLAPIPILLYSYYHRYFSSFFVGFCAFLVGGCNDVLYYFGTSLPTSLLLNDIICSSLVFGFIIVLNKWVVKRLDHWLAILVFPSLWTSYEFFLAHTSPAGSLTSFAYDQIHFLSFVQLASFTGIWGVSFVLLLFSSGISYAIYCRRTGDRWVSVTIAILLPLICISYGYIRLHSNFSSPQLIKIALIDIKMPTRVFDDGAMDLSKKYISLIQQANTQKPQFIVLPEKFIRIHDSSYQKIIPLFQNAAAKSQATLILGVATLGQTNFNSAVIINPRGQIQAVYHKQHLLPGAEDQFTAGKQFFIANDQIRWGTAICKDMDFSELGKYYGRVETQLLLVPALDFNVDGWLHGRVAMMRGIENGFAVARSAGQGLLTITDQFGRIIAIKADGQDSNNILITTVMLYPLHTFYAEHGDWFAWFILILLSFLVLTAFFKKNKFTKQNSVI